MTTTTTQTAKSANKSTGFILFALVIVAAVLIAVTMVSDLPANRANAGTARAHATRIARCGMDEQTYTVQLPPMARYDIETRALCSAPAEIQP